jgi:DNA primase
MNSAQAKRIPLARVLEKLGHKPHHQRRDELLYLSPFRQETEPSFSINETRNVWFDFGEGKGGNVIDFVMEYYSLDNVPFALRKLESLMGHSPPQNTQTHDLFTRPVEKKQDSEPLIVRKIQPLQNKALTDYLGNRGITVATAKPYLKEIYYTRKDKTYFALAFKNDSGDYELRNPYFKGVYGTKDITTIESRAEGQTNAVTVFEGFMDFLSALEHYRKPVTTPVIVMNSTALKERTAEAIRNMNAEKAYLYLDHDTSGREITEYFRKELDGVDVLDKSDLYAGYKDFNEWLVATKEQTRKR